MSRARVLVSTVTSALVCLTLALQRPAVVAQAVGSAVQFNGTNQHVTFGAAPGLGASTFTLELWFKRTGAGVATSTGANALNAIPLLTKGRAEGDASAADMNYFLGIDDTTGSLAADFEEGPSTGGTPGLNHPVKGATPIQLNVWYHAAATYDGQTWRLYLNGVEDGLLALPAPRPPRADSTQHAGLGTAMNSTGVAQGFFAGVIDEARVWNVARTAAQIQSSRPREIASAANLIGRWGMNEGSGTTVNDSAGSTNGTISNGATWVAGVSFDTVPPAAPANVSASDGTNLVTLAWTRNPEPDIAGYNVYRGMTSPVLTSGAPLNGATPLVSPIYTDRNLANGTTYLYVVTAVDTSGNASAASGEAAGTPTVDAGSALEFNGSSQHVTFGQAAALGTPTFTLETWFKRTGAGSGTNTGTGGIADIIPLISKGRAEAEGSAVDMNYIFGIESSTGLLAADFEDTATGGNHPVRGVTAIPISTTVWHHAAATYDGTTWRLYLDGNLERTLSAGAFTPRFDSIQHAGVATAFNSSGVALGFFAGIQDEVRIWNHARTQAQIQSTMYQEVSSAAGLLGRWGVNEATGTTATNSIGSPHGTLVANPGWVAGYPFAPDAVPPAPPAQLAATAGNNTVGLSWTANTEADLAGYNVYRSTSSPVAIAGPLNGTALLTSPSYVDATAANGTTYYYVVTAQDIFGNVSAASSEAVATPQLPNQPPIVNAGPDQTVVLPASAALTGSASDPDAGPGALAVTWSSVSGPAAVTFDNANASTTAATFTVAGTYVLRLSATDGAAAVNDEVSLIVSDPVLVGAGDIVPDCTAGASTANAQATGTLLDGIAGTVFTLGDNAYQDGTAAQFATCYEPAWGRHKARTRPVTGNHDYQTPNATPYFDYFNGSGNQTGPAGDRGTGYYSYDIGTWHVVVLNSECAAAPATPTGLWQPGGCAVGSAQETWLRADLAASTTNNIIAMWHKPRFSSSASDATNAFLQPLWQALYEGGVDIVMGGHWHNYERLAPTNANGVRDDSYGIRQFVVGTGGVPMSGFGTTRSTSELRNNVAHGVLKLTLHAASYDWQFIPIGGQTFTDSGTSAVHDAPPPPSVTNVTPAVGPSSGGTSVAIAGTNFGTLTPTAIAFGASAASSVTCTSPTLCTAISPAGTGIVDVRVTVGARTSAVVAADRFTYNQAPAVNAGPDQGIVLPATATLAGSATDDGFPDPPGLLTAAWTKLSGPGTATFADPGALSTGVAFTQSGSYVLRLSVSDGQQTSTDDVNIAVNAAPPMATALGFNGTNQYVTFGQAPDLGATTLTLELWFKRQGAGLTTSTGSGGVTAEPLLTKGRAEAEGSNVDMNYFLGIDGSRRVLVADFEDSVSGANHPVSGTTLICDGLWYHAAATYDGTTWRLYLNGVLESQVIVGSFAPRADSIQHAALATAMTSTGAAAGFFNGTIDEARVWSVARSAALIAASMSSEITSAAGLLGRWGLSEGFGAVTEDSTANASTGTLVNSPLWVAGTPFTHTPLAAGNYGLALSGSGTARDHVAFGAAPALGAATFTLEAWIRRDGAGIATSTGTGGVTAVPLITKGMAEADGTTQDMNYFLGIRATDNVLVADFEDAATGANHPVFGVSPITDGVWHHVAATFDGATWTLYVDGVADRTVALTGSFVPRADSIQHAALGTALNSTGGVGSQTQGFFDGVLDEPRIWNYARSAGQIASGMGRPIPSATGLIGRWSLDSPCTLGVADTSGSGVTGTLIGSSWNCVAGAPVTGGVNQAPSVEAGSNQTVTLPAAAVLPGVVTDDDVAAPLTISWSMISGPGLVTFGDGTAAATTATFSVAGSYVLQLSASDGELTAADSLTVTATESGPVNRAPVVDAGPDQTISLPSSASLVGTVSDDGLPGTDVTTTWSRISGPGTVTFGDGSAPSTTASFSAAGSYVLQLAADDGEMTGSDTVAVTVSVAGANGAIDFGGTNGYVSFGPAPVLGASSFTLELWFKREGAGIATSTGSGGIDAVPLVSKGRAQTDGSNVDMNYFFGINGAVLAADFEEGAAGATPGLNHPVSGVTTIATNVWYHAAATYDGTTWRLYLNGVLDAELAVGQPPRADSIQHAAIASALTSSGAAAGFFDGVIDEVRIWNHARTAQQIQTGMNLEIAAAPGLLGRWGLNEAGGATVVDSTGNTTGTVTGAFTRVAGTTFRVNQPPGVPTLSAPSNGATGVSSSPTLTAGVTDGDNDPLTVTFFGRPAASAAAPEFTLVAIPDTQHYVDDPARAATFTAQTQWIVDNRTALNIAFVSHLGDIVEHIDAAPVEWSRANASLSLLEANNFKWGLAPGNHDMSSAGVAANYDLTFPVSRFENQTWYGGYLGKDPVNDPIDRQNKDNYELFSVGALDFLIIHLEYDMPDYSVAWADRILKLYPNRRAIISTHLFLNASGVRPTTVLNRANGTPAETVWQQLVRTNCNVFLVLNGHYPGEANRTDLNSCGQPVHQLASDYQSRTNGGDGWLRYMTFKPAENRIHVYTFSPTLNLGAGQFERDANSEFVLEYGMQGAAYTTIATSTAVAAGSTTSAPWPSLAAAAEYEWYVTVNDGQVTTTGPVWRFSTGAANSAPVVTNPGSQSSVSGASVTLPIEATDADGNTLTYSATGLPTGLSIDEASGVISGTVATGATSASVTVTVSDGMSSSAIGFAWEIVPSNTAPVAQPQSVTTAEETATNITLTASDADNDPLTFAVVTGPSHGTLTGTAPDMIYTPAANYSGADSFTFRVNDGTADSAAASVTLAVTATPDAPVIAAPGDQSSAEGASVDLQIQASDADGDTLTYSAAGLPAGLAMNATAGRITGTLSFESAGAYNVTVTATDSTNQAAATAFTWAVSATNRAPVATSATFSTPKNRTLTGTVTATDADSDPLTFALVAQARKGSAILNAQTGAFTYTPSGNANGSDTFTFRANDGNTDSNLATVTIRFTTATANTAPVASNGSLSINEDSAGTGALVATDADGNTLTYRIGANGARGTATINATTGAYSYTPQANANGGDVFTFIANDGTSDSNTATVTVTIVPVNDAPIANNDAATTSLNTAVAVNVLANDTDPDQEGPAIASVTQGANGSVAIDQAQVVYTPALNFSGQDTFTYRVRDAAGVLSPSATVTVTVSGANTAPSAQARSVTTPEDLPLAITLSGSDPDGQALTFSIVVAPAHGTLSGTAPNVTYTPSANYNGADTFSFRVHDGITSSAAAAVSISVTPVNDAPVASDGVLTVTRTTPAAGTLVATDVDGAPLTFEIVTQPRKGQVVLDQATGAFTYTAGANGKGSDGFTFRAYDGVVWSNTARITVTIR